MSYLIKMCIISIIFVDQSCFLLLYIGANYVIKCYLRVEMSWPEVKLIKMGRENCLIRG